MSMMSKLGVKFHCAFLGNRSVPVPGFFRAAFRLADKIRIRCRGCFSQEKHTTNACIPPLLLCCTGAMSCSPCCHPTIIRLFNQVQRNTCELRAILQRFHTRKEFSPFLRIARLARFHPFICLESHIRFGVFPTQSPKFLDF